MVIQRSRLLTQSSQKARNKAIKTTQFSITTGNLSHRIPRRAARRPGWGGRTRCSGRGNKNSKTFSKINTPRVPHPTKSKWTHSSRRPASLGRPEMPRRVLCGRSVVWGGAGKGMRGRRASRLSVSGAATPSSANPHLKTRITIKQVYFIRTGSVEPLRGF